MKKRGRKRKGPRLTPMQRYERRKKVREALKKERLQSHEAEGWVTPKRAAEISTRPINTVYNWMRNKRVRVRTIGPKEKQVSLADVRELCKPVAA